MSFPALAHQLRYEGSYENAVRFLARRDRILRAVIRQVGPCTLLPNPDGFAVLVRAIIGQQLSTRAAAAIRDRLEKSLGRRRLSPGAILRTTDQQLRSAGLSAAKVKSLKDLALQTRRGIVPLRVLHTLPDDEVIAALMPVRGIGRWTAQMFLIFSLGRRDILPVDDWGLRVAVQRSFGLPLPPLRAKLEKLGERWQPYRSIATWYFWRSLNAVPQLPGKTAAVCADNGRGSKRNGRNQA
jgi:DNA-3-methyladenine glycosylase II